MKDEGVEVGPRFQKLINDAVQIPTAGSAESTMVTCTCKLIRAIGIAVEELKERRDVVAKARKLGFASRGAEPWWYTLPADDPDSPDCPYPNARGAVLKKLRKRISCGTQPPYFYDALITCVEAMRPIQDAATRPNRWELAREQDRAISAIGTWLGIEMPT